MGFIIAKFKSCRPTYLSIKILSINQHRHCHRLGHPKFISLPSHPEYVHALATWLIS